MKKKIAVPFFIVCLIWLCSYCARSVPDLTTEEALTMLQKISDSPLGLKITVDAVNIQTAPAEGAKKDNPHYLVTVKNPEISMSSEIYQQLEMEIPDFKLPIRAEELVFVYGPADEYCEFRSAKNVDLSLDLADFMGQKEEPADIPNVKLAYHFGSMTFKNYNISPLLSSQDKNILEVLTETFASAQNTESQLQDMRIEFDLPEKGIQADFSLESAEAHTEAVPELLAAFLKKDIMVRSFSQILEEGKPLFNLNVNFKNQRVSIKGLPQEIQAQLGSLGLEYYLKPSSDRASFIFGYNLKIGGFDLTGLKKKEIEALTGLNEMNLEFSLDQISPEFLDTYFEVIRSARSAATSQDPAQQQEMAMQGMTFVSALMKSKPTLTMAIKPLDHKLGRAEAEAKFQFVQAMGPPIGKGVITIFDVKGMADKLKEVGGIPDEAIDGIMSKIKEAFVIAEDGRATLTLEVKADEPGKTYLNGKPLY